MEDILDIDMVSNFISAAMLLKELDSIIDDIMACWEEKDAEVSSIMACWEEKDAEVSSIMWTSFFIDMEEDSLWLVIIDPAGFKIIKLGVQNYSLKKGRSYQSNLKKSINKKIN